MTYKNLKKYLSNPKISDNKTFFDLVPNRIKSKIILCVGENACNTACFLSSIMITSNIKHSRYICSDDVELKDRFIISQASSTVSELSNKATNIIKRATGALSNDELLFILALKILDNTEEYLIIEVPTDFYINTLSKCDLPLYSLMLCFFDDEKSQKCISLAPQEIKEIIALSDFQNYDYVSTSQNKYGTRTSYVSSNKYRISRAGFLCGTEFYYFTQLFYANIIDQHNVPLAALSIESARVLFEISYPMIAKGLGKAKPIYDIQLWSLSPTILFYNGKSSFTLPLRANARIITDENETFSNDENVIFCGDTAFINKIKSKLKK